MEIIGKHVEHSVFGDGIVTAQDGSRITISFKNGDKRFSYPDIFRHFCTIDDEQLKKEIEDALLLQDHARQEQDFNEREGIRNVHEFKTKYRMK